MRKLLAALALLALCGVAWAQTVSWPPPAGTQAVLCVYNTTPVTWSNTNVGFAQCDNKGNLIVSVSASTITVTGSVTATSVRFVGITPTDRTITSATGASQLIMSANASRHGLVIQNTGSANCGVNPTGGTAVIAGAGTITLTPNGAYYPAIPTLSAVTGICTAGQPLYAEEN